MMQRLAAYLYLLAVGVSVTVNRSVLARVVTHHARGSDAVALRKIVPFVVAAFIVIIFLLRERRQRSVTSNGSARTPVPVSTLGKLRWLYNSGGKSLARRPIAATITLLSIVAIPAALVLLSYPGGSKGIDAKGWILLG